MRLRATRLTAVAHAARVSAGAATTGVYETGVYEDGVYSTGGPELLTPPADLGWAPPVAVYYEAGTGYYTDYDPAPWLAEGAPGVTTYYVDGDAGNDANPGTSASPKKSLVTISAGRQSKLLIYARGTFYIGVTGAVQTAHDEMCVVAWGGAACSITTLPAPSTPFVWTDEGVGVWSAPPPFSSFNGINPYSGTNVETLVKYPLAASLAACQATPGTFFRETSPSIKHYIHTLDGSSPATGHTIFGATNSAQSFSATGRDYVQRIGFYGVTFMGGDTPFLIQGDSAFSKRVEFVACAFKHAANFGALQGRGNSTIITYGCTAGPSVFDGFSYHTPTGAEVGSVPFAVEIGNTGRNNGFVPGANQGSTSHFGGKVLRVNCTYRNNTDDQMADVGTGTRSWNVGCTLGPRGATTGANGIQAGNVPQDVRMWLDGCSFSDVAHAVSVVSGGAIYYRNMAAPSVNPASAGTVTTY